MAGAGSLLAKSGQPPITLQRHTADVLTAARALLDARAAASLATTDLPNSWEPRLRRLVLLGALVHDFGKCSDHFQELVAGRSRLQLVRHEALGLLLATDETLRGWLRRAVDSDEELMIALFAAAGHHRRFAEDALRPEGAGRSVRCRISHPDFARTLRLGVQVLGLSEPPSFAGDVTYHLQPPFDPRVRGIEALLLALRDLAAPIAADPKRMRLLAVVKALLIDADVAGSVRMDNPARRAWVLDALGNRCTKTDLAGIAARRLGGEPPHPFQRAVGASAAPLTLVHAGCGAGKTVAAYLWARQHAGRQLWFAYPTTGTATEGFRDYLFGTGLETRLEHGRREVDLELLGLTEDAAQQGRDVDRLAALRVWGAAVVACTVDTVLGLLQNQRKGLYAWAGLAQAAVVFDEVHAFDARLFGALLRLLRTCPGTPVLLMTASLPAPRLRLLQALSRDVHGMELPVVPGPDGLETLLRYRRVEAEDPWPLVRACLQEGGKVLWVSNTVARCLERADEAGDFPTLVYHSRFKYRDRVTRHAAVIDAFRRESPCLAFTTQVAEMSLDLSADLLVTDLAPVPALIQRLGRLNRRATPERPGEPRPFLVLPYGQPHPYLEGLDDARAWLDRLGPGPWSQRDLVAAWTPDDSDEAVDQRAAWLDGGFDTVAREVREGSPGVTVLLDDDDLARVRRGELSPVEVAVPMGPTAGLASDLRSWRRHRFYPVPPLGRVRYDALRGAEWR